MSPVQPARSCSRPTSRPSTSVGYWEKHGNCRRLTLPDGGPWRHWPWLQNDNSPSPGLPVGAGTCSARYLNAPKLETFVVEKIRERILNEETIVALVTLVAEEIDAMAGELSGRLEVVETELSDVRKRLEKLYEAIETSELTLEVLSPRIMSLRHREEQLEAARDDAETQLEQRRVELPNTEEIARYVADFRDFLKDGTIPERKALIRNFVEGIEVMGDEATLTYTVPMPSDGAMSESASVLDFVKSGPPHWTKSRTFI